MEYHDMAIVHREGEQHALYFPIQQSLLQKSSCCITFWLKTGGFLICLWARQEETPCILLT